MIFSTQVTSYGSGSFFSRERNITWIPSRGELSISRSGSEMARRVSSFNGISRLQSDNCGILGSMTRGRPLQSRIAEGSRRQRRSSNKEALVFDSDAEHNNNTQMSNCLFISGVNGFNVGERLCYNRSSFLRLPFDIPYMPVFLSSMTSLTFYDLPSLTHAYNFHMLTIFTC